MSTPYVYKLGTDANPVKRHYNRFRPGLYLTDDTEARPLTTRYTDKIKRRYCKGPRGGKALQEYPRFVYYLGGRFYHTEKVRLDDGTLRPYLIPVNGAIWDAHADQSRAEGVPVVQIICDDGAPVSVVMDGDKYDAAAEWETFEAVLMLDKKPRKSPKKSDAPANVKSDENDAPAPLVVVIEPATVGGQFAFAF